MKKNLWHNNPSTDGIDYIHKQKFVKVSTERLDDLDKFPFPNSLLVKPVEELMWYQKILGKFRLHIY